MLLLSSADPAAGAQLRGNINKYKALAKSAPTFGPVAQLKSDLDRMIDKARHDAIELDAYKPNLTRAEADLRIAALAAKLKLLGEPPHTL
jgi:hypothetical protein